MTEKTAEKTLASMEEVEGMKKAELLEEALRRDLDVDKSMPVKFLVKAIKWDQSWREKNQQDVQAASTKSRGKGGSKKKKESARSKFLKKAAGSKQAEFYEAAVLGAEPIGIQEDKKKKAFWGYKKPQAECILAILYKQGKLSDDFAEEIAARYPNE